MKKKILSMILSAATLLSLSAHVAYAADVWKTITGTVGAPWGNVPSTYYVTSDAYHTGSTSLFVNGDVTGDQLNMFQNIGMPDTSSNYVLTFYAKEANEANLSDGAGLFWSWNIQVRYSTGSGVEHLNAGAFTRTKEAGDWWKYTATYKPTDGSDPNLHIIFNRGRNDIPIYIDDISLVKEGTDTNLVKNGGFEDYNAIKPSIGVTPGDGKLTVNWTNPAIASSVITVTVGDITVDTSSADLNANASNSVEVTGLENGTAYEVKVTNTTAYGDYSDSFTIMPRALTVGKVEGYNGNAAYFRATTRDSYSGKASLNITGTWPSGVVELIQGINYEVGSQYKVTVYGKGLWNAWNYKVFPGGWQPANLNSCTKTDAGNGWTRYEYTYTPSDDGNFHIQLVDCTATVDALIDNITVVKVGDETNTNILANGDFENFTELKPVISVKPDDGKLTINWTNPAVASTAISVTVGGEAVDVSSASLEANALNSVEVTGLTNNTAYEVVVTNTTAYGDGSDSFTIMPRVSMSGTAQEYSENPIFTVTTSDSYSGKAALRIKSDSAVSGVSEITCKTDCEVGVQYEVTLYGKGIWNPWNYKVFPGGWQPANLNSCTKTDAGNGWTKYVYTYSPTDEGGLINFHIQIADTDRATDVLIDNISVVKVGDETNTNILANGGFENFTAPSDAAKDAYFDAGYICWTVDGTPDCFKVYKVVDGQRNLINVTESGKVDYCEVGAVNNGDEFVITSVYGGYETKGVTIKAELSVEAIFGTGTIAENGKITITEELDEIQAGTVVAGVKILNYVSTAVKPDVYVALYNGGKLVSVNKISVAQIPAFTASEAATIINVPESNETDSYSIKVFTWNADMSAICGDFLLD